MASLSFCCIRRKYLHHIIRRFRLPHSFRYSFISAFSREVSRSILFLLLEMLFFLYTLSQPQMQANF